MGGAVGVEMTPVRNGEGKVSQGGGRERLEVAGEFFQERFDGGIVADEEDGVLMVAVFFKDLQITVQRGGI